MSKIFIPLGSNCITAFIGMMCGWCRTTNEKFINNHKTFGIQNSLIFDNIYIENISTVFDMFKNRFEDFLKLEDISTNEKNPTMSADVHKVDEYQLYNTKYRYKYHHNISVEKIFKQVDYNLRSFVDLFKLFVDHFVKLITENECVFVYFIQNNDEVESINKHFKEFDKCIRSFNPNNEMWYFVGNDLNKIESPNTIVFEASTNECLVIKSSDRLFKTKLIIDRTDDKNQFIKYFDKTIGVTNYDKYLGMKVMQVMNQLQILVYLLQNDKFFYRVFYYYKKRYPGIKLILDDNISQHCPISVNLIKNYIECTDESHLKDVTNTYLTLYNYNTKHLINISDVIDEYLKMKYKWRQ